MGMGMNNSRGMTLLVHGFLPVARGFGVLSGVLQGVQGTWTRCSALKLGPPPAIRSGHPHCNRSSSPPQGWLILAAWQCLNTNAPRFALARQLQHNSPRTLVSTSGLTAYIPLAGTMS